MVAGPWEELPEQPKFAAAAQKEPSAAEVEVCEQVGHHVGLGLINELLFLKAGKSCSKDLYCKRYINTRTRITVNGRNTCHDTSP